MMDTRIVEYITAIYEEKNLTRAAERLFITQSALNQQLRKLEKELGTPLFEKKGRQMVPTGPGRIYLSGARMILEMKHNAEKQLANIKNSKSGFEIRFAFFYTMLPFFQQVIEPAFSERVPDVSLKLVPVEEKSVKSAIKNNQADLGLMVTPLPSTSALEYIPIRREEIHLAFPAVLEETFPAATGFPQKDFAARIHALSSIGYIQHPEVSFLNLISEYYLKRAGIHPHYLCQASSVKDLFYLLNQQFACGLIPETLIQLTDTFGHMPLIPEASYYLGIAYKKDLAITLPVRELILLLLHVCDREYEDYDIFSVQNLNRSPDAARDDR